jgi:hypothetical protein
MSATLVGRRRSELLRELHDQHAGALWRYVMGLTNGDSYRAQDVVQETLLRAWRNPAVLERTGGLGARLVVHGGQAHRHRRMAFSGSPSRSGHSPRS